MEIGFKLNTINITKTPEKERVKGGWNWSWTKIFLPLGFLTFVFLYLNTSKPSDQLPPAKGDQQPSPLPPSPAKGDLLPNVNVVVNLKPEKKWITTTNLAWAAGGCMLLCYLFKTKNAAASQFGGSADVPATDSIVSSAVDPSPQEREVNLELWKQFATREEVEKAREARKISNFKGSRVAPKDENNPFVVVVVGGEEKAPAPNFKTPTVVPPTEEEQAEMVNRFISHLKNMDDKAAVQMLKNNKYMAAYRNEKGEHPLHQSFKYVRPLVVYHLLNKIPINYLETNEGTTKGRTCLDWLNARNEKFEYEDKLGNRSAQQYKQDANKCYRMFLEMEGYALELEKEKTRMAVKKVEGEWEKARKVWEKARKAWDEKAREAREVWYEERKAIEKTEEWKEWEKVWEKVWYEERKAREEAKKARKVGNLSVKRKQKQYEVGIVPVICQNPNSRFKLSFDVEQKIQGYLS